MDRNEFREILDQRVLAISPDRDLDIIFFNGPVSRDGFKEVVGICADPDRNKRALLILNTYGGDAHAGYRISRTLRQSYQWVTVYVPSLCKSAGTLIAIGASELIIGDFGELGPLDVQVRKDDELFGETASGLNLMQALNTLQERAFAMFESALIKTKIKSGGQLTTKSASELANTLAIGVFSEIYKQIDPVRLGEIDRALNIANDYGNRLSGNLKEGALEILVAGYPSHSFVIDREEASELFLRVRPPTSEESALAEHLESLMENALRPVIGKLNSPIDTSNVANESNNQESTNEPALVADTGAAGDEGSTIGTIAGPVESDASESVTQSATIRNIRPESG